MPPKRSISMRVWLAVVVAAIVTITAVAVAEVLTVRSESAFRERAAELAAGAAVTAAADISAQPAERRPAAVVDAAASAGMALFLFDRSGRLISAPSSNGIAASGIVGLDEAVTGALDGVRLVRSTGDLRIVIALPLRTATTGALVGVASRPDLVAAGDIVRGQLGLTVLISLLCGAALGTALAVVITSRVRRVTRAAGVIEAGAFDEPLSFQFNDELGQLGDAVNRMRVHLRDSFAALEAERDHFRSFLEQLQEGVVAVDADLEVVFANSRARLQIGRRALAPGQPLPEPWAEAGLRDLASSLFAPGALAMNERVHAAAGDTYAIAGLPARGAGQPVVLVITDVTVAERRERAEREFVSNAAHELRTPIAAIASAVEVLRGGAKDDPDARDRFLSVLGRQSERLDRLIRALLTLARAQTRAEQVELEAVDVAALLAETAEVFGMQGEITIDVECAPGLVAWSHYDLLYQAVGNLAENAVKHADGNPVRLSAAATLDGQVRIEIRDHGHGIAKGDRDRLFDRFYRGDSHASEGFGLGLAIVGGVVAVLGGEVEIEPAPDGGTLATILVAQAPGPR